MRLASPPGGAPWTTRGGGSNCWAPAPPPEPDNDAGAAAGAGALSAVTGGAATDVAGRPPLGGAAGAAGARSVAGVAGVCGDGDAGVASPTCMVIGDALAIMFIVAPPGSGSTTGRPPGRLPPPVGGANCKPGGTAAGRARIMPPLPLPLPCAPRGGCASGAGAGGATHGAGSGRPWRRRYARICERICVAGQWVHG